MVSKIILLFDMNIICCILLYIIIWLYFFKLRQCFHAPFESTANINIRIRDPYIGSRKAEGRVTKISVMYFNSHLVPALASTNAMVDHVASLRAGRLRAYVYGRDGFYGDGTLILRIMILSVRLKFYLHYFYKYFNSCHL